MTITVSPVQSRYTYTDTITLSGLTIGKTLYLVSPNNTDTNRYFYSFGIVNSTTMSVPLGIIQTLTQVSSRILKPINELYVFCFACNRKSSKFFNITENTILMDPIKDSYLNTDTITLSGVTPGKTVYLVSPNNSDPNRYYYSCGIVNTTISVSLGIIQNLTCVSDNSIKPFSDFYGSNFCFACNGVISNTFTITIQSSQEYVNYPIAQSSNITFPVSISTDLVQANSVTSTAKLFDNLTSGSVEIANNSDFTGGVCIGANNEPISNQIQIGNTDTTTNINGAVNCLTPDGTTTTSVTNVDYVDSQFALCAAFWKPVVNWTLVEIGNSNISVDAGSLSAGVYVLLGQVNCIFNDVSSMLSNIQITLYLDDGQGDQNPIVESTYTQVDNNVNEISIPVYGYFKLNDDSTVCILTIVGYNGDVNVNVQLYKVNQTWTEPVKYPPDPDPVFDP
jgi:hypothetical protein